MFEKRKKGHHAEWITAVYWLVLFSIVFHGLSIPALNLIYKVLGVPPVLVRPCGAAAALPKHVAAEEQRPQRQAPVHPRLQLLLAHKLPERHWLELAIGGAEPGFRSVIQPVWA